MFSTPATPSSTVAEDDGMEKHLRGSALGELSGIFSADFPKMSGSSAWAIPHKTSGYHISTDASLFSSSVPVLPHEKANNGFEDWGKSVDDSFADLNELRKDTVIKDPLKIVEPTSLALLPDDEELLAGIIDELDLDACPTHAEDLDDDLFGSGGGMEMDFDPLGSLSSGIPNLSIPDSVLANGTSHYVIPSSLGTVSGEHPYGEHPSRTLFVRNINSNVEDSELRELFEQYGDIRTLYTACKHRGFVMISYYDIRAARTAMRALQNKALRRRKLDIHFSIPKDNPSEKDINQGTLVIFNLDPSVSNEEIRQIFGAHGEVKEIRETPNKRHHKFIEFYDVRAAEAALKALNGTEIAGKRIKLEPSRPGGARRNLVQQLSQELEHDEGRIFRHHVGSPVTNSPPGNWTHFGSPSNHNSLHAFSKSPMKNNHMPGLASILPSVSSTVKMAPIGKDQGRTNIMNPIFANSGVTQGSAYQQSSSFPEQNLGPNLGPTAFSESKSNSSGVGTLSGPQFLWGSPTSYSERGSPSAWPTSSMGNPFGYSGQNLGLPYPKCHGSFLGSHQEFHVGSAPSGFPFDRHVGYSPDSPDTSSLSSGAFGGLSLGHGSNNYMLNVASRGVTGIPVNMIENGSPNFRTMSLPRPSHLFLGNSFYHGPGSFGDEAMAQRGRSRRPESSVSQIDNKKQYQLDLDKIISGEDTRTTLMIKNIPNKYTSKMLLAAIDENHKGTYDFLYLPIDFKNKCNVGYAFINMLSPSHIISFYEAFNGKKWEKFNSEKVASLAYARIQGKTALVAHFQNSSLMNEDKKCRPIIFHSEGEEVGSQDALLSSKLNICIRQPDGSYSTDTLEMN